MRGWEIKTHPQIFMNLILPIICMLVFCICPKVVAEDKRLAQIPKADQEQLETLFSFLALDEGFAYVLFGNKPMSRTSQRKSQPCVVDLESLWNLWEKYAYLFPINDFLFFPKHNEKWFNVYLINKKSCLKVIEDNLSIFQEKMGYEFNSHGILDYIAASDDIENSGLKKSHALIGILFGYGTNNALGFEKYNSKKIKAAPNGSHEHVTVNFLSPLFIPCFVSFSEEETNELVSDYKKQRNQILEIYSKENILEITLQRLTKTN